MGIQYRKTKIKLNYLDDKPTRYKIHQLTYPQVTYEMLINEVSQSRGVNSNITRSVVDALLNRLIHYMEIGHGVSLGTFGSFKPTFTAKTVKAYDDATSDTIQCKKVRFFPGGAFKQMLKEISVTAASEALDEQA